MASSKSEEDSIDFSPLTEKLGKEHSKLKEQIPALGDAMSKLIKGLGTSEQDEEIRKLAGELFHKRDLNKKVAKTLIPKLQDRLFAEDGIGTINDLIEDAAKILHKKK